MLISKAGKGRYCKKTVMDSVVRYIVRQRSNETRKEDLIAWGALGAPEWRDAEGITEAFGLVQQLHTRRGKFGRYIDHEIYEFSLFTALDVQQKGQDMNALARTMAAIYYNEGYQVAYAVHKGDGCLKGPHIHFAVNTVNYNTGAKRHDYKREIEIKGKKMDRIVELKLREKFRPKW